jgi:hypothetical protein
MSMNLPADENILHGMLEGLSDEEFERLYGPLARLTPDQAAVLLNGMGARWWIVGGWAIEAFTGVERPHEDIDVSILAKDVPVLFSKFLPTHHIWAVGSGMLSPILADDQPLPSFAGQIWIREEATAPWLLDINIAPDDEGRWVFKRDTEIVRDLEQTVWRADDGLLYQNPEITLAFKAMFARPKDEADLENALPLLDTAAKSWLGDTVSRLHPDHRWLEKFS